MWGAEESLSITLYQFALKTINTAAVIMALFLLGAKMSRGFIGKDSNPCKMLLLRFAEYEVLFGDKSGYSSLCLCSFWVHQSEILWHLKLYRGGWWEKRKLK